MEWEKESKVGGGGGISGFRLPQQYGPQPVLLVADFQNSSDRHEKSMESIDSVMVDFLQVLRQGYGVEWKLGLTLVLRRSGQIEPSTGLILV